MSGDGRLKVVLCWHMHQPCYYNPGSESYELPWTYLHAVKDYSDMALHLEAVPAARAVVNFAPTLLEQLEDYDKHIQAALKQGKRIADSLLDALAHKELPADTGARTRLITACLRANDQRLIARFPAFQRLASLARLLVSQEVGFGYLSDQFLFDILTWYHLAWIAERVRREDRRVLALQDKASQFTWEDRRVLLQIIGEQVASIVPRYRKLAERGQVELSVTPYAHPILPLLLNPRSARDALPDVHLPALEGYPGGAERARWHIEHGVQVFKHCFGFEPAGCWPAEGGVSTATLAALDQAGFKWAATGEQVLRNSLAAGAALVAGDSGLHRPYAMPGQNIACFFRDDGLSDLIGFTYATWHADDAVANLTHHLETIATAHADNPNRVVSIILDGENAWESYPENGYYFLSALYARLAHNKRIELTTFSDCLKSGVKPDVLSKMISGSWVYGTFSTWIGDRDKNHAWEMLVEAKQAFDEAMNSGAFTGKARIDAERQLALCEGSDWFWWFGDYNPADSVRDFDRLYRLHLQRLYHLLRQEPPGYLAYAFSRGGGEQEAGGVMRRGKQ